MKIDRLVFKLFLSVLLITSIMHVVYVERKVMFVLLIIRGVNKLVLVLMNM